MVFQDDDLDYFLKEMRGVSPIKQDKKASLDRGKKSDPKTLQVRREAALKQAASTPNPLSDQFVELMGPFDPVEYKKDGVQQGVFQRLKQGRYPIDAALHLYKKTVETCRTEVFQFMNDCYQQDIRVALISFGKATSPDSLPCVIKSYLAAWLPEFSQTLAVCSAHKSHGGTSAVYVLIKKSERQKQLNRNRHQSTLS